MADGRAPLRLGFIGCGRIAQAHLKAAANLSDQVRVVAIAGRRRDRAEATAREFGVAGVYDDYRQLLRDPGVQAVVVTTPNDSHAGIVCDAAKAGKHILVEKPMALDTASAEAMVRAADAAGVTLMVAQSRRFSDAVETMVRRLPEIGDLIRVHITFLVSFAQPPTDWWRSAAQAGGLVIFLQGSHSLDSVFWWFGKTPQTVYATGARTNPAWEGEDEADILCRFRGRKSRQRAPVAQYQPRRPRGAGGGHQGAIPACRAPRRSAVRERVPAGKERRGAHGRPASAEPLHAPARRVRGRVARGANADGLRARGAEP